MMSKQQIIEFTERINKIYTKKTGNRLILREFASKWYLCRMIPLGEETIYSGTLDECTRYMECLVR